MEILIQAIENSIKNNFQNNHEKISNFYLLEKFKYLILEGVKGIHKDQINEIFKILEKDKEFSHTINFNNIVLLLKISLYDESHTKLKTKNKDDILTIALNGTKLISIFDLKNQKKSNNITIYKNTGIVLSQNTVTSEKISSGSMILNIFLSKLNIEK